MLRSFDDLQSGLVSPKVFQSCFTMSRVYDIHSTTDTIVKPWHRAGISTLDLDKVEDRYLLSGAKNGDLAIHDLLNKSGHVSYTAEVVCSIKSDARYAHRYCVSTVQWYPFDTGMFISSSMDKTLKIWDTNCLRPAESISMEEKIMNHHLPTISSQHSLIAVAMKVPAAILVDPRSGSRCHQLRGHRKGVCTVKWSPTAEYLLATGGEDGKIFLWDVRSAKGYLKTLDQHNGEAIGSRKDLITAHERRVNSLRFTDDGLYLISHGTEGRMRLWDVAFHKNTLVNFGATSSEFPHIPIVMDLCGDFSHPALFVPCNRSVCIYDLYTGDKLKSLVGHFDLVTGCAFRTSTHDLYSCGQDKNVLVWTPDVDQELEEDQHPSTRRAARRVEVEADEWSD